MPASESLLQQIAAKCVHFTGLVNKTCRAGVVYDDVTVKHEPTEYVGRGGTYVSRQSFPCLTDSNHCGTATCALQRFLTPEEAEASERRQMAEITDSLKHIGAVRAHIVAQHSKWKRGSVGVQGTMPCPKCVSGTLHWSRASLNGHVWGRCSTLKCLSWME